MRGRLDLETAREMLDRGIVPAAEEYDYPDAPFTRDAIKAARKILADQARAWQIGNT